MYHTYNYVQLSEMFDSMQKLLDPCDLSTKYQTRIQVSIKGGEMTISRNGRGDPRHDWSESRTKKWDFSWILDILMLLHHLKQRMKFFPWYISYTFVKYLELMWHVKRN